MCLVKRSYKGQSRSKLHLARVTFHPSSLSSSSSPWPPGGDCARAGKGDSTPPRRSLTWWTRKIFTVLDLPGQRCFGAKCNEVRFDGKKKCRFAGLRLVLYEVVGSCGLRARGGYSRASVQRPRKGDLIICVGGGGWRNSNFRE